MSQPIPGYQLVRELGRGGMGIVYLAVRGQDRRAVALKTLLHNQDIAGAVATVASNPSSGRFWTMADPVPPLHRFLRQADILRRLDHPGIVQFQELGAAGAPPYFTMEHVRGHDAGHLLRQHGPLSAPRAIRWVVQLLEALGHLHDRGFVHRDVKPGNLLVSTGPDGVEVVKLCDFGIARCYRSGRADPDPPAGSDRASSIDAFSDLTLTGIGAGTPGFVAPEQARDFRGVGPPADQYSAGATLYCLLTGRSLPGLHPVEQRFRDVGALRDALLPFLQLPDRPPPHESRPASVPGLKRGVCVSCGEPMTVPYFEEAVARQVPWFCYRCLHQGVRAADIPGYRLVRELQAHIASSTYLALDEVANLPVLIDTVGVYSDSAAWAMLVEQIDLLRRLRHPGLLPMRDSGQVSGLPYFTRNFVPWKTADNLLHEQGPLPVRRAVDWAAQLLDVLGYLHEEGILHRSVAPRNLIVVSDEGRDTIRLVGFERALDLRNPQARSRGLDRIEEDGIISASALILAPEELRVRGGLPADQFCAAVTLFRLLTGRDPFEASAPVDRFVKMLNEEPPLLHSLRPEVPVPLSQAVGRALSKDPGQRFADVRALRQALLSALERTT
jgi:serine/threonine protein kinase